MTRDEVEAGLCQHRHLAAKAKQQFEATGDAAWQRAAAHHTKWVARLEAELATASRP